MTTGTASSSSSAATAETSIPVISARPNAPSVRMRASAPDIGTARTPCSSRSLAITQAEMVSPQLISRSRPAASPSGASDSSVSVA